MEDVEMYPIERPSIGDKRMLGEFANEVDFTKVMPGEKRNNSMVMIDYSNNLKTIPGNERGEKRSASDALQHQSIPKENSLGEQQEKEIIKRITAKVLSLPKEHPTTPVTVFHGLNEPSIAFSIYVERLVHYANVWAREKPSVNSQGIRCALLAIIYLERSRVVISTKSVHRLFLIAFLIGIKLTDDFGISNTFWGKAGGCVLEDVNRMEIAFCGLLGWDFGVSADNYENVKRAFIEGI